MQLALEVLENDFVRLEPMEGRHREDLRHACAADALIWESLYPVSWGGEAFDATWAQLMTDHLAGRTLAFVVKFRGEVVGLTTFYGFDPANGVVEIGGTYYRPEVRGGAVNPAAKRLMMENAFSSGARRVVFRIDALNARSLAAVRKLGAVQEGVLRQDRITWTGRIRDTVILSVLDQEWPAVRQRLDARLADFRP